jgi:hypothetical protein
VDLVEAKLRPEQLAALDELALKRRDRQILDLMHDRVHAPFRGVRIAPHFEATVTSLEPSPRRLSHVARNASAFP